ncbi:uncharacterized protein MJAP1_002875 [Malassezia japonica]|uniref:DUF431-domain-containing protein n=1 Tax=Malassezia japonica TaxID=223818 RepID=A0AAF0F7K5_9BASI|nr:uncharacterized protein MJAP1_002875 [Malassezia japonica]WFD39893.1 hypothetical protein MJAP1_002875 [Malassezia japonica]
MARPEYIIEHMEEEEPGAPAKFPPWALLEYRHMLYHVGAGSTVHFTSLSEASLDALEEAFAQPLRPLTQEPAKFELHSKSITTLAKERNWALEQICLLDPKAPLPLSVCDAGIHTSSAEAAGKKQKPFTHFLFGGILGDDPPRDRTASLRELGFPGRHLGSVQMSTDTALGVTKRVVEDGARLGLAEIEGAAGADTAQDGVSSLTFIDSPTLDFGRGESVELPYRYLDAGEKQPLMAPGMRAIIYNDFNRSFEF